MPAAALGHESDALDELDARLHCGVGLRASSLSGISSHAFMRFHAIASSAGPTNRPMKPKAIAPPKTPRTTTSIDRFPARLMRIGLTTLSTELMTATPWITTKIDQPTWSWK